jgi:integrase
MAPSSTRQFLQFLGRPITPTAASELIAVTKAQHNNDDFTTDDSLQRFAALKPVVTHFTRACFVKGVFRANHCPLYATFDTHFSRPTKKIGSEVLKAIYDSLDDEHRALMDYQAYAGERVGCISRKVTLQDFEDFDDRYTLIRIKASITKARNNHICIIPKQLADWIREYSKSRAKAGFPNSSAPFPNYETLWRDITKLAFEKHAIRLTSHYLRKRFHTIAGKTPMPVNSWDYLMGDKQSWGHEAGSYTLEDFNDLVSEYGKYLAPYLSIREPREPEDPRESSNNLQLERILKENRELKDQLIRLTELLAERLTT